MTLSSQKPSSQRSSSQRSSSQRSSSQRPSGREPSGQELPGPKPFPVQTPPPSGLLRPADLTVALPGTLLLSSRNTGWQGVCVDELKYEGFNEVQIPPLTHHALTCRLRGPTRIFAECCGQRDERVNVPGDFSLCPAGAPKFIRNRDSSHILHVRLDAEWVAGLSAMMGATRGEPEILNSFGDTDPQVLHGALALKAELEGGCPGGPLFAQHLALSLAVYLLGRFSVFPLPLKEYAHGLGKSDLARVLAYIRECLTEELSLDELAACVHLSPYHFARLFKQSVGVPPHEYILRERVEKAKDLLRSGRLTVGDVAQAVGFSDHSKLDRHFKRLTGLSPRQFRRQ